MEWIPFLARIGLYAVLNYFALSWYMDASNVYENRFYLNIPVIHPLKRFLIPPTPLNMLICQANTWNAENLKL